MYFDYAATTPPRREVLETFEAVNRDFWANPESLHRLGARAESVLEQARKQVLALLGAEGGYRCVFTSGATESNNMAIIGAAKARANRGRHLITSAVEHPSVAKVCEQLESEGWELTTLPVNAAGAVDPAALRAALRPDTTLVSLMHVNNEIGAVNDIAELGRTVKEAGDAVFHVDAAQSVGKFSIALGGSNIDLLTFSAHKFFGLKSSGALVMKSRMELPPLLYGGGQEGGLRSGTADPARAAALAKALRLSLENLDATRGRVVEYKKRVAAAFAAIPDTTVNGSLDDASPFILNYSVAGVKPETLLQALAEKEMYISTVSACSARATAESAAVWALTGSQERARTSVRVSLAGATTGDEVDALCQTLEPLVDSLRFNRK